MHQNMSISWPEVCEVLFITRYFLVTFFQIIIVDHQKNSTGIPDGTIFVSDLS